MAEHLSADKCSYLNEEIHLESVESHMMQFGGGEVVLLNDYWHEGIAILQMNNAVKKNAISGKMMVDFRKCIAKLDSWKEGKAVILCSVGDHFCSGGDLDFAKRCNTPKDGFYLSYLMQDVLLRLRKLRLVSIAMVQGAAIGGGAEIAVSCDYILVCENVKFGFVHGKMGIITAWGGTARLIQAIGEKQALDILLTSKILNAKECIDIGLATQIIKSDEKLQECLQWTRAHTQHHYSVTRAFKQASLIRSQKYEDQIKVERTLFAPLWGGEANQEALNKNIKHITHTKN